MQKECSRSQALILTALEHVRIILRTEARDRVKSLYSYCSEKPSQLNSLVKFTVFYSQYLQYVCYLCK
jgi:hypothetical protein